MNHPVETVGLLVGFVAALVLSGAAVKRLCCAGSWETPALRWGAAALSALLGGLVVYRAASGQGPWLPLASHLDGLLLLITFLAVAIAYTQFLDRMPGLSAFAMPLLALLVLWAVCASWWTFRPFGDNFREPWKVFHLICVYVVAIDIVAAAAAGGLWLLVDRQLRLKGPGAGRGRMELLNRLSDLESIEAMIVRQATVGFVLLSLALVSGLFLVLDGPTRLGAGWWYAPKVLLVIAMWLIYALVMHVRFVPTFRGRRAAILAIVGFVLMIAAMGASVALPALPTEPGPSDGLDPDRQALSEERR